MATFTRISLMVITIYIAGAILNANGEIENGSSDSIVLEYKMSNGMSLKDISEKYMKDIYERMGGFRIDRKYKDGFNGKKANSKEEDNAFEKSKSGQETQWNAVNDYVGGGDEVEESHSKKSRLSTLTLNLHNRMKDYINGESKSAGEVINMTLHPLNKPFVNFTVTSNATLYGFEVGSEPRRKYLISVVVEKMNCTGRGNSAKLYIGGENGESILCKEIDDSKNRFQSVSHVLDGNAFVNVTGIGDWETFDVSATLVASVYYETPSCSYCEANGHFCCGRKDTSCRSVSKKLDKVSGIVLTIPDANDVRKRFSKSTNHDQFRCIPKEDMNESSTLCNGHPNCGFHCNLDELKESCPKNGDNQDDYYCSGYYCREYSEDRFIVTILLLILFCVFVPFCVFLFLCGRRDVQRNFGGRRGRCPLPLEIIFCPLSMSEDAVPGAAASSASTVRTGRVNNLQGTRRREQRARGRIRSEEAHPSPSVQSGVNNFSFLDDLPPSYAECLSNKETYPNVPFPTRLAGHPSNSSSRRVVMPELIPSSVVPRASTSHSERFPLEQIVSIHSLTPAHNNIPRGRVVVAQSHSDRFQETFLAEPIPSESPTEEFRSKHVCQCKRHRKPIIEEGTSDVARENESLGNTQEQIRIDDNSTR